MEGVLLMVRSTRINGAREDWDKWGTNVFSY